MSQYPEEDTHPARPDINFAIQAAGIGAWQVIPGTNKILCDDRCKHLLMLDSIGESFTFEEAFVNIDSQDSIKIVTAIEAALTDSAKVRFEYALKVGGSETADNRVLLSGASDLNGNGLLRFGGVVFELTTHYSAIYSEKASQQHRNLVDQAPVAMMLLSGAELVIETANQNMLQMLGKTAEIFGNPLEVEVPGLATQVSMMEESEKITSENSVKIYNLPYDLAGSGTVARRYIDFTCKPLYQDTGIFYGFVVTASDVTVTHNIELENLVKTFALDSCNLIIGISRLGLNPEPDYNNNYTLQKLGWKDNKGRTLLDAVYPADREMVTRILPDILKKGGGTEEIRLWNEVTGEPFWVEWNVFIIKDPESDEPIALATISPDISERKLNLLRLQEQSVDLRNAIEMAQLGTWSMDLTTGKLNISERYQQIFGLGSDVHDFTEILDCIIPEDRERLSLEARCQESPANSQADYAIINAVSGLPHFLRDVWQTYYDHERKPIKITGIVQDITTQRDLQTALESMVEQRTRELEAVNEELTSSNEEFLALNEELEESNQLLFRSNEDLQRFAYVASHDLQEPLRKIQQFGSLLEADFHLASGKGKNYLERMQSAARRMSSLIEDLLTFSRVSSVPALDKKMSLDAVLELVKSDLEFVIEQTNSIIEVGSLPEVIGDATQMGQLFQNLVSNALKFRKADAQPNLISVNSTLVDAADLPLNVKPTKPARKYHRIDVSDQGIGFDEVFLDRIFQVFQRLHGRTEYTGTGIGLAICEKVVNTHGGAITASSILGQGSVFHVYLPADASGL